jgi:hypothetical protein
LGERENTTITNDLVDLSRIMEEAISPNEKAVAGIGRESDGGAEDRTVALPSAIIAACLTRDAGLVVDRRQLKNSSVGSRKESE